MYEGDFFSAGGWHGRVKRLDLIGLGIVDREGREGGVKGEGRDDVAGVCVLLGAKEVRERKVVVDGRTDGGVSVDGCKGTKHKIEEGSKTLAVRPVLSVHQKLAGSRACVRQGMGVRMVVTLGECVELTK